MTKKASPLIAIVDSDDSDREAIRSLLVGAGYRTAVFASGRAFLNGDRKDEAGCLILDMQMPGLNGLDVHRQLAEMNISIPTVFVIDKDAMRASALAQGGVAALRKPFSNHALLKTVESALKGALPS